MSEQNKDNISQFFRKAVQKPKISFEEGDWEKLEAKLDVAASRVAASKPNHWKTAFIAAVALLFISTSLLLYTSYQVKTLSAKAKTDKSNLNSTVESVPKKSESEKHTAEKQEPKDQETKATEKAANLSLLSTDITGQEIRASVESNSSEARDQHLTSSQVSEPSNTPLSRNNNVSNKTLVKNSDITNKKVETSAKSITSETRDQNIASSQVSGSNNKPFQNDAVLDKALFADAAVNNDKKVTTATQSPDGEAVNQSTDDDSTSSKKEKEPIVKSKKSETELTDSLVETVKSKPSRWSLMLSLSPDFSSTDLGKFSTPGSAFGIAAYYAVNNRLSVSAGVVKSSKFYWDSGDEYKPNQTGYWAKKTNGIVPTVIEGSCSVLEIPVGLQYYFVSARKNKLYLASTLSSYIMLKEAYQYTFDAPNPGAAESWNAKKTSYFLFSIANLSVGYERSISNRLMIGVSPYLKIPMSGVGSWANIKLYSTGASFTLRYQFQKKKKPDRLIPAD